MTNNVAEVLRLKLFQETACYKKPTAFKVGETYPLPPYSTVKGMLHHLLNAKQYIPMKLCIQGTYEARVVDYQSHYFFKKRDVAELPLTMDGLTYRPSYQHMTTMPIYMHMLLNVSLVIHISAETGVLTNIEKAVKSGVPISLGRWEDLVRVDECRFVALFEDDEERKTPYPMYWPLSRGADVSGVPYRLNWKYDIVRGIRQWKRIKVRYIQDGFDPWGSDVLWDDQGHPVIFPKEMEEQ